MCKNKRAYENISSGGEERIRDNLRIYSSHWTANRTPMNIYDDDKKNNMALKIMDGIYIRKSSFSLLIMIEESAR